MTTKTIRDGIFVTALVICSLFYSNVGRAAAADDPLLLMGVLDQFEWRDTSGDNVLAWDAQGWLGKDLRKLWIKTDGERAGGETEDAELQFLYSKAFAKYWDFQVGIRHDFEPASKRTWAAIGIQGLAPYFFETDIAFFVGESGRTALRIESEYELLITQRLIFTPDIEVNFYGKDDANIGVGSGLSDAEIGLRLRYEIRREFAPYLGINWTKVFGNTADFARINGQDISDLQLVVGLRGWF
jgi:copper resistance protein B